MYPCPLNLFCFEFEKCTEFLSGQSYIFCLAGISVTINRKQYHYYNVFVSYDIGLIFLKNFAPIAFVMLIVTFCTILYCFVNALVYHLGSFVIYYYLQYAILLMNKKI